MNSPVRLADPGREAPTRHEPEPVVHVSIGRVEIRAAPDTPSRPAVRAPRPAGMSLDEYLQRRQRERAR